MKRYLQGNAAGKKVTRSATSPWVDLFGRGIYGMARPERALTAEISEAFIAPDEFKSN